MQTTTALYILLSFKGTFEHVHSNVDKK